jgi:glucan phosphorylase
MSPTAAGQKPRIAYFSLEIAFEPRIPTYSGGLGVLAGDTLTQYLTNAYAAETERPTPAGGNYGERHR